MHKNTLHYALLSLLLLSFHSVSYADMKDNCPEAKKLFSTGNFQDYQLDTYNKDGILFRFTEPAEGGRNDCCQYYKNFSYIRYHYDANRKQLKCDYHVKRYSAWGEYDGIVERTFTSQSPINKK